MDEPFKCETVAALARTVADDLGAKMLARRGSVRADARAYEHATPWHRRRPDLGWIE